jgi:hypothetical protein
VPGVYDDLEEADLVVLVGSNLAWCHPVLHQRLLAAKALRPSMRIVVVDPRRTASAEGADLHLRCARAAMSRSSRAAGASRRLGLDAGFHRQPTTGHGGPGRRRRRAGCGGADRPRA